MVAVEPRVLVALLEPFDEQSRFEHLSMALGGATVFALASLGLLAGTDATGVFSGHPTEATLVGSVAFVGACIAGGCYFAVAWTSGFGGPLLTVVYWAVVVYAIPVGTEVVLGVDSGGASSLVGFGLLPVPFRSVLRFPVPVVTAYLGWVAGAFCFTLILGQWQESLSDERRLVWERTNLPAPLRSTPSNGQGTADRSPSERLVTGITTSVLVVPIVLGVGTVIAIVAGFWLLSVEHVVEGVVERWALRIVIVLVAVLALLGAAVRTRRLFL